MPPRGYLDRKKPNLEHVTSDDVGRLSDEAATVKTRLMIRLLWITGGRISEVIAIKAADVDARRGVVTLRRLKRRKKVDQEQPIPRELAAEIRTFIRAYKIKGRLFRTNRKTAWRTVNDLGRRVLRRSIAPKHFRHGRAYALVAAGMHPMLVARIMGHASMQSTLAYYHPTEADLRKAIEATA